MPESRTAAAVRMVPAVSTTALCRVTSAEPEETPPADVIIDPGTSPDEPSPSPEPGGEPSEPAPDPDPTPETEPSASVIIVGD